MAFPSKIREPEAKARDSGLRAIRTFSKAVLVLLASLLLSASAAISPPAINSHFRLETGGTTANSLAALHLEVGPATALSQTPTSGQIQVRASIQKLVSRIFDLDSLRNMIFGLPLWVALAFTLAMERIIPAAPARKLLSIGFAHDMVWFLYEPALHALVSATYVGILAKIYRLHFSYLTFSGLATKPAWMRFMVALLLVDFGYWVQHVINHKVPFLWKLHSVHHSQQELNFFSDFRYHPLEYVVRHTFITIPFLFLAVNPPVIAAFAVVKEWYSRFYHGNIRTNLGPLKYLLVTPQSHRVHHSFEERHRDLNFGAIFSFWDFLFRTQYRGFDEYPATGITEESFPRGQELSLKSLFLMPWRQMLYPFSRNQEPEAR